VEEQHARKWRTKYEKGSRKRNGNGKIIKENGKKEKEILEK
jgi:hypothetical protein